MIHFLPFATSNAADEAQQPTCVAQHGVKSLELGPDLQPNSKSNSID